MIRHEGLGVLFTALSGTGKSTQAELWEKYYGAEILNGNRALIRKEDGGYRVYGSPYAGSSYIYWNESAPLSAVFVLKQAKEKFLSLLSQFLLFRRDSEIMDRQIDAITELMDRVPVCLLECRPDREAADWGMIPDFSVPTKGRSFDEAWREIVDYTAGIALASEYRDCPKLDTPPAGLLTDAGILAQYAHGILFVVKEDFAKTDKILEAMEHVSQSGCEILGCILNDDH